MWLVFFTSCPRTSKRNMIDRNAGHCRRRKIRCMPAFDDPAGRCQNCIRLKKDCHFFPVDQQNPPPGRRVRSATKSTEGGPDEVEPSVSSSSPSAILRSSSFEQFDHFDGPLDTSSLSRDSPSYAGFHPGPRPIPGTGWTKPNFCDKFNTDQDRI